MTPEDLATLLDEANHHPWESVKAALSKVDGQPHPRIGWLTAHLAETKRRYWLLVAEVAGSRLPPDDAGLTRLMEWEIEAARELPAESLNLSTAYEGMEWSVASLLRLNARHTAWHAGQIAALARRMQTA
ncbi:hypothetical protein [Deinococcus fonticola]|uniref:hypothetical protein n=1 Tax=Deinococcus fonticola TaxID=2528713 RepID=UPI00107566B6|nr:hypothetical protein [Deinococcus fonticola]